MLLPVMAFAVYNPINNASGGPGNVDVATLANNLLAKIWIVFAAIAVLMFLIAGILFLTAAGDADKVKTARNAFLWGVAGVVVGIIAFSIISIAGSLIT